MRATVLLLLSLFVGPLNAQNTYTVSVQYGYDATDATAFLQAALNDPTAATIIIDNVGSGVWVTDGLLLNRDNVTIQFEPGVVLEALPNALGQFESLLNIRGCNDILIEGNGATLRMDKSQYPANSEFRHCIITRGPQNVTINDLTLTGAAGDGIEVAPDFVVDVNDKDGDGDVTDIEPVVPSRNITLNNLICDANNRQGMSVIDVIGLQVNNCTFSNTAGTLPESGVDFEPFQRYQVMQNIVMTNCTFSGNNGHGIQFGGVDINAQSAPSSILIEGALVFGNGQATGRYPAAVNIGNRYNPFGGADQTMNAADATSAPGTFTLRNSIIRDEPNPAINVRQYASGLAIAIENVTIERVANTPQNVNTGPILVQPPEYGTTLNNEPCFGGVDFTGVTVTDDQTDRAQVTVTDLRSGPTGPSDVTGTIVVNMVAPVAGAPINYVDDPDDCGNYTLSVVAGSALPVSLTAFGGRRVADCAHELYWEIAAAERLTAFTVESSSDGRQWRASWQQRTDDTHGLGKHRVRLPQPADRLYRLRSDFLDGTVSYSPVAFVAGCGAFPPLAAWPNPTSGALHLTPADQPRLLRLVDLAGRTRQRFVVPPGQTGPLELAEVPAGVYVLRDGRGQQTRIVVR